jgi:type IV secretory pathway VirB10-like protein
VSESALLFRAFSHIISCASMSDSVKDEKEDQKELLKVQNPPVEVSEVPKTEPEEKKDDEKAVEPAVAEVKPAVEEEPTKPAEEPVQETPVVETVEKVVDQFENMTIFGNKSLDELHKIQSKRSHLSAGILFTDPSLKM